MPRNAAEARLYPIGNPYTKSQNALGKRMLRTGDWIVGPPEECYLSGEIFQA